MVTDSPCPVCGGQVQPGERQCPRCDWELESDYVLGRLAPEQEAVYQEQLAWARRLWQERQQREVAQRELTAAQAELARLRQPLEAPHREPIARQEVRTREQPPLLALRGTFVAPELIQQGMVRRLGRGVIHTVIPVEGTLVVVVAGGGTALFDLRSGQAIWEIDCPARCGVLSPDGSVLALGTGQHVWLWNLHDGRPLCTLDTGRTVITGVVAFSPDGALLASVSTDATVRLWSVQDRRLLRTLEGRGRVDGVAFSPDGTLLASAFTSKPGTDDTVWDYTVCLWRVLDGQLLHTLKEFKRVSTMAFSPDGALLASGVMESVRWDNNHTVRLWSVQDGRLLHTLNGHMGRVNSVVFSPDGTLLASGSADRTVRLWRMADGQSLCTLQHHTADRINGVISVAFSSDGAVLTLGSADHTTVCLWNVPDGQILHTLKEHTTTMDSVTFSHTGSVLASGLRDGTVRLWSVQDGRLLRTLEERRHVGRVVAFSPDGALLASGSEDYTVCLWSVQDGRLLRTLKGLGHPVVFSPDGTLLTSGSGDYTVCLWSVQDGRFLRTLKGHRGWVKNVAFSPDGTLLASGSADRTVRLWRVANGRLLHTLDGHREDVTSVVFSPDGTLLASGSRDHTVCLWQVSRRTFLFSRPALLHTLKIPNTSKVPIGAYSYKATSVAFSPDGVLLVSRSWDDVWDDTVHLWRVADGQLLRTLEGLGVARAGEINVGLSPDGVLLASGALDGMVRLWQI